jgi:DNA-binding LacI/PurR family transcriptional regulator
MGRVTLQTIADHLGVSRMTVSNAFSRPDQLSAQLREQILAVADELGYVGPNPTARALSSGTAGAVGLLMTDTLAASLTDDIAMSFMAAIAEQLTPTGLALTLISAAEQGDVVPARDVAIDGALVYSCDPKSSALGWLMRRQIPLVFVDQAPAPGIASVNVADREGAKAAAAHLVELGHHRIAVVTSGMRGDFGVLSDPLKTTLASTERQRLQGWLDALDAAGIAPLIVRLPHGNPYDIGYAGAKTVLENDPAVTAVLCFSDAIARGVIEGFADAGRSVPDDISVVGFDDSPVAQQLRPPLTTVHQDVAEKGRIAAQALVAAIERNRDARTARERHVVLPTELVVRRSTAPPRSDGQDSGRARIRRPSSTKPRAR